MRVSFEEMKARVASDIQRGVELQAETYSIVGPIRNLPSTCIACDEPRAFVPNEVPLPCCEDCMCWMKFHFPGGF